MKLRPSSLTKVLISLFIFSLATAPTASAWWFLPDKPATSVQPTHTTGLSLDPFIASLIPSFILEPLQQTTVEEPPVIQAAQPPQFILQPLATPTPSPTPSKISPITASVAQDILRLVNQARQQHGLEPLQLNNQLTRSAQDYAQRMSKERFFSHTSPDGQTFRQRNEQAGYVNWQWMGENIAQGQTSASEVMDDWLKSEGHRNNILSSKAKELGVGFVAGTPSFWVQEFGLQFE